MKIAWEHFVGLLGLVLLLWGWYLGLFDSPREAMMGEVARILYVHVPAAWLAMVTFTIAGIAAMTYVATGRRGADSLVEAACEVGVMECVLLLVLGAIFARPTWGVWWTWDPRLTSSAVMCLTFIGVLLLRVSVKDPSRRALWSSIATILAFVNIPITYMSVKWFRSMHQLQSSPTTMSDDMVFVLRLNAFAFLFLTIWFLARRWRIAEAERDAEAPPPLSTLPAPSGDAP